MTQTGLILFAHGSRDPEWASTLNRVRSSVHERSPDLPVKLAFLELMQPDLQATADALIAEGIGRIVVLPMFIAQGGHLKKDLPALIDALRVRHPRIVFEQAAPVGEAESVVQAMALHVLALSMLRNDSVK